MNNSILEASKSMLTANDIIREWFPKWTSFLECKVTTYSFPEISEPYQEPKIKYVLALVAVGSGLPVKTFEGETLYELLTKADNSFLSSACDRVIAMGQGGG